MGYIGAGVTRFNTADGLTVSGDAQIDTNTLVVDSTNNRVGVGTASPTTVLDVAGTVTADGLTVDGNVDINGNYVAIGDGTATTQVQLIAGTSGNSTLDFGDSADNNIGRIEYVHANDAMTFRTNNSERMRIDSSGNLLVGTTSTGAATASNGAYITPDGQIIGRSDGIVSYLNRRSTNGQILQFMKDGTQVGNVGTVSGYTQIVGGDGTNGSGLLFSNAKLYPLNAAGSIADGSIDVGVSNYRFKDLYLSGGAYLGGTGSANKLEDYEEGTWTPTFEGATTAGTGVYTYQDGLYTKIGNSVTVWFLCETSSFSTAASGALLIKGLPFSSSSTAGFATGSYMASDMNIDVSASTAVTSSLYVGNNFNYIKIFTTRDNTGWAAESIQDESFTIYGTMTYRTD